VKLLNGITINYMSLEYLVVLCWSMKGRVQTWSRRNRGTKFWNTCLILHGLPCYVTITVGLFVVSAWEPQNRSQEYVHVSVLSCIYTASSSSQHLFRCTEK